MIEKAIKTYFPERVIINPVRNNPEDVTLQQIENIFHPLYTIERKCDLNAGIKALWEADEIEGLNVWVDGVESVAKHIMKGSLSYKTRLPEEYERMLLAPLNRTSFRVLVGGENFTDKFTSEPGNGFVSFSNYPSSAHQINNVINRIIELN